MKVLEPLFVIDRKPVPVPGKAFREKKKRGPVTSSFLEDRDLGGWCRDSVAKSLIRMIEY